MCSEDLYPNILQNVLHHQILNLDDHKTPHKAKIIGLLIYYKHDLSFKYNVDFFNFFTCLKSFHKSSVYTCLKCFKRPDLTNCACGNGSSGKYTLFCLDCDSLNR